VSPLFTLAAFLNFLHKASKTQHRVEACLGRENGEFGATTMAGIWATKHQRGVFAEKEPPKVCQAISFGLLANSRAVCGGQCEA